MARLPFEQLEVPGGRFTVFLDVDGTLVPDGGSAVEPKVAEAVSRWKARHRVLLCSNTPQRSRVESIARQLGCDVANRRYRKPNPRILAEAGNPAGPLLVVGDRGVTDGLFSRRIGATFIRTLPRRSAADRPMARLAYLLDDVASAILRSVLRWPSL